MLLAFAIAFTVLVVLALLRAVYLWGKNVGTCEEYRRHQPHHITFIGR